MICPKCRSENVNVQIVSEKKRVGIISLLLFGILNLLRGSKTRSYAVCQNCGHKWKVNKFMNTANTQMASQPVTVSSNTVIANNTLNASAMSILFHRPKNKRECLSVMNITVDDSVKFQLKNGASHPLSLSPGVHSVKAKLMPFTYKTEFIVENTPLTVECMVLDNSKPHITIK